MSGIYLSYNGNNRPNLLTVEQHLNSILPSTVSSKKSYITQSGFRLDYPNEKDVNHFFSAEVLTKLQELHLTPELCHETQKRRLVFIPNIQRESFYKGNPTLLNELSQVNKLNIIKVDTFTAKNNTTRRFIKIFLNSQEAQTNLIRKGRIVLDQVSYPVEAPHSATNSVVTSHKRSTASNIRYGPNGPQGHSALSRHSTWGDRSRNSQPNLTHQGQRPVSLQPSSPDSRDFSQHSSRLSEILYQGLERPEDYIFIYNNLLISNGFSPINVPKCIIDKSINIFLQNKSITNHPPPPDPWITSEPSPEPIRSPSCSPSTSPETPHNPSVSLDSSHPLRITLEPTPEPICSRPCSPPPSPKTPCNPSAPPESPLPSPPAPTAPPKSPPPNLNSPSRPTNSPSTSLINPITSRIPSMAEITNLASSMLSNSPLSLLSPHPDKSKSPGDQLNKHLPIPPYNNLPPESSSAPTDDSSNSRISPPLSSLVSVRKRSHNKTALTKPDKF